MIIRPAEEADVPQILDLIDQGTRESAFEGTYDRERATDYVRTHMHWDEAAAIVAIDDNEQLAGGFIAIASHEMWRVQVLGVAAALASSAQPGQPTYRIRARSRVHVNLRVGNGAARAQRTKTF